MNDNNNNNNAGADDDRADIVDIPNFEAIVAENRNLAVRFNELFNNRDNIEAIDNSQVMTNTLLLLFTEFQNLFVRFNELFNNNDSDNDNVEGRVTEMANIWARHSAILRQTFSCDITATTNACHTLLAIPNRIWWEDGGQIYFDNENDPFFEDPVVKLHILVGAIIMKRYYECLDKSRPNHHLNLTFYHLNLTFDECVIATGIGIKISTNKVLVQPPDTANKNYPCHFSPNFFRKTAHTLDVTFYGEGESEAVYDLPSDVEKLDRVVSLLLAGRCRSVHPRIAQMKGTDCISIDWSKLLKVFPTASNVLELRMESGDGDPPGPEIPAIIGESFPSLSTLDIWIDGDDFNRSFLDLLSHEGNTLPFNLHLKHLKWPLYYSGFNGIQLQQLVFDALPNFPNLRSLDLGGYGETETEIEIEIFSSIANRIRQEGVDAAMDPLPQGKNVNFEVLKIAHLPLELEICKPVCKYEMCKLPHEVSEHDVDDVCTLLDHFDSISDLVTSSRTGNSFFDRRTKKHKLHPRIEYKLVANQAGRRVFNDKSVSLSVWPTILARIQRSKISDDPSSPIYYALRHGPALCGRLSSMIGDNEDKPPAKKKRRIGVGLTNETNK